MVLSTAVASPEAEECCVKMAPRFPATGSEPTGPPAPAGGGTQGPRGPRSRFIIIKVHLVLRVLHAAFVLIGNIARPHQLTTLPAISTAQMYARGNIGRNSLLLFGVVVCLSCRALGIDVAAFSGDGRGIPAGHCRQSQGGGGLGSCSRPRR